MKFKSLAVIVLAAGKGTRMESSLAKVLQPLGGRPLLHYVLDFLAPLQANRSIIVVGFQSDRVRLEFSNHELEFAEQKEQLGTGHAVRQAESVLADFEGDVLVVCGDMPFVKSTTLATLLERHRETGALCTLLTLKTPEKKDFGCIIRDEKGAVVKIVEQKDASIEEKKVYEFNAGVYCFDKCFLFNALASLDNDNAQKEFYLTDTIRYIVESGFGVEAVQIQDAAELFGINSIKDLERAEQFLAEQTQPS